MIPMVCNECGVTWDGDREDVCVFCGSDDTKEDVADDEIEDDWDDDEAD